MNVNVERYAKSALPDARGLTPLDRLRYALDLVDEDLTALQIEQDAALARREDVPGMVRLARQSVSLRGRRAQIQQEIARTEREEQAGHQADMP
jgi:hypothetical protein